MVGFGNGINKRKCLVRTLKTHKPKVLCSQIRVRHTSIFGRWPESWHKRPTKHLQAVGVDAVGHIPGVGEKGRWLAGHCCSPPILIPPVQAFQEVELEIQCIGTGS